MTSFKRARSEEQRAKRRQTILDTAAAMLTEMPVAQLSLNELSRRVCLAKSNVLRYFESREEILLELLATATRQWLTALDTALTTPADAALPDRLDALTTTTASSLAARPTLCDLLGNQAAVLEHNVSPQIAADYKRATLAAVATLAGVARRCVPELGEADATGFAGATVVLAGALWAHSRPSEAMLAAYAANPDLAALRLDFTATLTEALGVFLAGLLARQPR